MEFELPMPASHFSQILALPGFNIVCPLKHPISQNVSIESGVKVVAYQDSDYDLLAQGLKDPEEIKPLDFRFYDLKYLRDCSLRGVWDIEWGRTYGLRSARQYIQYHPNLNLDSYVRIICMSKPNLNLKTLNQRYGSRRNKKSG